MKFKMIIFSLTFVALISCSYNSRYNCSLKFDMIDYEISKEDGLVINLSILNNSDQNVIISKDSFSLGDYNPMPGGRRRFTSFSIDIMESHEEILVIPAQSVIELKLFESYDEIPISTNVKKEQYPITVEFFSENCNKVIGYIFINTFEM